MGHTRENSATYILVSNFKGSMRLNAFIRYLGISDIKLSKNAVLEDGTHRNFDTPSVKVQGQPDMYILDNTQKKLILIENKVKIDRSLEPAQTSEDGYLAILRDYIANGYDARMVFLVPENYYFEQDLNEICKKHSEVTIVTWKTFFTEFDDDIELQPVKRAIQAIEIDGIEEEEDFLNQEVDFSLISPTIKKNEDLADYYIGQLIADACDYSENGKNKLWKKGGAWDKWQRPRRDKTWADALSYTEYCESPCIEVIIQYDDKIYMVAGYDYIKQKFCVYIQNQKNWKSTVEYSNDISLPLGLTKSYYALKNSLCEKLHDFIENEQKRIYSNPELK